MRAGRLPTARVAGAGKGSLMSDVDVKWGGGGGGGGGEGRQTHVKTLHSGNFVCWRYECIIVYKVSPQIHIDSP